MDRNFAVSRVVVILRVAGSRLPREECSSATRLRDVRQALMTAPTLRNLVNSNGVNSVVMGHSLGNITASVYTHFSNEFQQEQAKKLDY